MKTNHVQQPLVNIEKQALKKLCKEVKECLATEVTGNNIPKQQFGVADLWNIHRTIRYRVQRRSDFTFL
jgi:hypothetical protein